jgi:2,4-dienoyl-CoA reductase (NADPH2)
MEAGAGAAGAGEAGGSSAGGARAGGAGASGAGPGGQATDRTDAVVLHLQHHPTGQDRDRVCDWVVCAVHQQPEDALWYALADAPFAVHRIGDCLAPRRAHAAVVEGHRVAMAL